jgi:hypothetical protein
VHRAARLDDGGDSCLRRVHRHERQRHRRPDRPRVKAAFIWASRGAHPAICRRRPHGGMFVARTTALDYMQPSCKARPRIPRRGGVWSPPSAGRIQIDVVRSWTACPADSPHLEARLPIPAG